ncbi:MAG TPA: TonB-dependent receptor [Bryobacteraceae bacterium]|nr:TonB-dependent receptor [Bryobacteraceae bacterium]
MKLRTLLLALCLLPTLPAQVDTGTIAGTLTDSSGAVLPGASVVIRQTETHQEFKLSSNELGQFVSPPLPPGPYEVAAEKQGFQRTVTRIQLTLNQRAVVNLSLQIGASQQEVTVAAETTLLETETTTMGNLRTGQSVRDLPLNGRNFASLLSLTTGVVPAQQQVQSQSLTPMRGVTANTVNGVGFRSNQMLVDGMDNTEVHNGQGIVIYPPIEAIQEFNVQTSVASAEFGRGGGNINIRLKSGAQEVHGALFEFLRNSSLDAKNFFDAPGKTPPLRMNQFGGVVGGPVLFPGRPRNRTNTFFFFDYEGLRFRQAQTFRSTVPLPTFLDGDFSASPNRIFDPATTTGQTRTQFPNNMIPQSRIDKVGRNLLAIFPAPNLPGISNNYLLNPAETRDGNNWDLKIDHRFSDRDLTFYRFSRHLTGDFVPGGLPAPAWGSTSAGLSRFPVHQFVASYTHMFTPLLVNEARAGVGRLFIDSHQPNYGVNVADQVGIPGINSGSDVIRSGLPQISIGSLTANIGDSGFRPTLIISENWQYSDNLSWYRGAHTFKFGGQILRRRYNLTQSTSARGIYSITGIYTQNLASPAGTGFGPADTLLGLPANGNITLLGGSRGFRRTEFSTFAEDSWKLSPSLTLNLGLRYEMFAYPWAEVYDRQANFLPSRGDVFTANTKDLPERTGTTTDKNNFGPRVGLAWKLNSRTVVRAAYGVFYQGESVPETNLPSQNPPFTGSVAFTNNAADLAGARRLSQGFPISTATAFPTDGAVLYSAEHDFALPYTQQWNVGLQRELRGDFVLAASYVGTKGTGNILAPDINQPAPGPGAVNPRRPFPRFSAINEVSSSGSSTYHALQATAEKRVSHGLSFLLSYTWAHGLSDGDFIGGRQNLNNLRAERGRTATDLRHRFVGSWTWALPFGRNSHGVTQALIGGWQANGILSLYGGLPFTVSSSINTLNGSGGQRANRIGSGVLPNDQRTLQRWFDIGAFVTPAQYQFGNSGVNILEGPGTRTLDYSMFKNFYFSADRRRSLQFRGEMFNLFNTPQFNNPNAAIGGTGAGTISTAGSKPTFQRTSRSIQFALKLYF